MSELDDDDEVRALCWLVAAALVTAAALAFLA